MIKDYNIGDDDSNKYEGNESYYLKDLSLRQNRPITSAQLHLFKTAKRYHNKDLRECIETLKNGEVE